VCLSDGNKAILDARQKNIELDPQAPTLNTQADWSGVHAVRMMQELIARERGAVA
jgi:hypothetical protein